METVIAILRGPLEVGLLYPQIYLEAALLVLKLFDVWSTNYIVGRKGGKEEGVNLVGLQLSLALWFINKTDSVQGGLAADFVLVAACGWLIYPLPWPVIAGVVAWYAYWMAFQVSEVRKSQLK